MISIAKFKSRAFLFLPDWTRSSWITNPPLSLRRPRPERGDRRNRKAEGSSSGTSPFCWLVVVLYHLDMVARIKTWTSIGTVPNLSLVQWRFCKWFVQDSSLQIAVLCTRREGPRLRVRRLLCWEGEKESCASSLACFQCGMESAVFGPGHCCQVTFEPSINSEWHYLSRRIISPSTESGNI